MAVVASPAIVVGATPTLIATNALTQTRQEDRSTLSFLIKNSTKTASVFLDGTDAVTTSGWPWDASVDGPLSIDLEPGESLYGIVASVSQTLSVLAGGR